MAQVHLCCRFAKNWVKLRVWNMTDLDAIVMLDSDLVLQGDIRHLFSLPTDFAWVTDAGPGAAQTHSGGVVFLRPCRAVADDMIKVRMIAVRKACASNNTRPRGMRLHKYTSTRHALATTHAHVPSIWRRGGS